MVTEEPQVRNGSVLEENLESLSRDLAEGAGRYCCKLWPEAEGLELPNLLPPDLGVAVAGGTGCLPPHLGGPGTHLLAPLGAPHCLRDKPPQLLLALWHGLLPCTDHPDQAAGLALLGPPAPHIAPGDRSPTPSWLPASAPAT
ncbi:unnamed protein product, partial [Bubo scandiacus]